MSDQDPKQSDDRRFKRPWEAGGDDDGEEAPNVVPLPGLADPESDPGEDVFAIADQFAEKTSASASEDSDSVDWESMAKGPSVVEDFTSDEYITATTQEYRGLADEVSKASETEWEQQAVAAAVPGVESGLVGFEDVGAAATESEESYEALEQAASSDLTMRIASALVIFGLFAGSLLLGGWWFSGFVILVMIVAVGELYATLRTRKYRPLALFGLVGVTLIDRKSVV